MAKNKVSTKTLSGFIELLPQEQILFDMAKNMVESVYSKAGFIKMDTPIIEKSETLFAKAGGETEKQVYRFEKGSNDLTIRFDLTVPFARYIAEHSENLVFPFKRYQIDKSYRAERPQRGRYREFYQADIDIVSENILNVMYDADIISTIGEAITQLNSQFDLGGFEVKISNRKIWDGFFDNFNISGDAKTKLMILIDKKPKMSADAFAEELSSIIDNRDVEEATNAMFSIEYLPTIGISIPETSHNSLAFLGSNEISKTGLQELEAVMKSLDNTSIKGLCSVDLSIVRGLDYYTGVVFETFLTAHKDLGSIASGGRYENLCDNYTNKNIIGVGGSIGLSRLFIPLIQENKISISNDDASILDVLILPQNPICYNYAFNLKRNQVFKDKKVSIIFEEKKFKKLMEYANKLNVKYVVIIGEEEIEKEIVTIKNMVTGEQYTCDINSIEIR